MKRALFILIASALVRAPLFAGTGAGADFLKIPIGARAVGLGQAFTALSEGTDAFNWNVAGIAPRRFDSANRFSLSHQVLFFGNTLDHMAVTTGKERSAIGLSVTRLSYPKQDGRDENRNETGSFGANDIAAGVGYARSWRAVRAGTQVKYLREDLAGESASGFALDLGLLSPTPVRNLQIGVSAKNLGPSMKFVSESFDLPTTLSFGGAWQVKRPIVLALDFQHRVHEHQTAISLGSEFMATQSFSLRAGYVAKLASAIQNNQKSETNRGNLGGLGGINGGFGLQIREFSIDYAISPFGELGDIHTLTLSMAFGQPASRAVQSPSTLKSTTNRDAIIFDPNKELDPNTWDSK